MDELINIEKKIKGYGYDSLCLRYNIAREAQAEWDVRRGKYSNLETSHEVAERDKMKFYQILNDLLGEHD